MSRLTKRQQRTLKEVLETATMQNARFSYYKSRLPQNEEQITPFIRDATHLWRETYIIAPLRQMLEDSKP